MELGGTIDSCSAWGGCTRGSSDPLTTEWNYKMPAGAMGGNTLYFYVLTTSPRGIKNFNFTASCPP